MATATAVNEMTVDDLRTLIEETVRRTLEEYLNDLRLLLPPSFGPGSEEMEGEGLPPIADRPLKSSLDH